MKKKTQAEIVQTELATNEIPINWCHIKAIMDTGCGYIVLYCVQCYCILTFLFFWICLAFECIFSSEFRPTLFFVLGMDNWTEMLLFYIQKSNVHLKPISFIVFIDMCFFFGYFQCIFFSTFSGHECVPLQGQKKAKNAYDSHSHKYLLKLRFVCSIARADSLALFFPQCFWLFTTAIDFIVSVHFLDEQCFFVPNWYQFRLNTA